MDLADRIARRRSARSGEGVFVDRNVVSPVAHRPEPVGRGPVLEQLLDALDDVFDGGLPPDMAVVGPHGSGTSAVVTALFGALNGVLGGANRTIGTTTRAGSDESVTWFVTVDARWTRSEFAFYRDVLSVLSSSDVPESGVGTDELRDRLAAQLDRYDRRVVVAVDHHDEPEALTYVRVRELLAPVAESVAVVLVGSDAPSRLKGPTIEVPGYRYHELVDVVTERASAGLAAGAIDHESTRDLAAWADGNAHDALAALFGAAALATENEGERIDETHLERAMADVPDDGVHVGRALSLPETRQRVLHELIVLEPTERPIREVAAAVAARSPLTAGTVERFLYELADYGVIERVPLPSEGGGRRPSTVEPRFPTIAFRELSVTGSTSG